MQIAVRAAQPTDHGRCRELLPEAFPLVGRPPELLVAEHHNVLVGACAIGWLPRGFPILVHVVEDWRRKGVGRALVAAASASVVGETAFLRPWRMILDGSGVHGFLAACGFNDVGHLHVYEMDPAHLRASIGALLAKTRKRIPSQVSLVPPRDAPQEALLELIGTTLTTPRPYLADALFQNKAGGYDQELSFVVLIDGAVAGAVLAHRFDDTFEVDMNVVDPARRGSWVNLLQVDEILQRGYRAGLARLRFLAAPHVKNTISLADRGRAERLPDQLNMVLPINGLT